MRAKWLSVLGVALVCCGIAQATEPVLTRLGMVRAVSGAGMVTDLTAPGWVRSGNEQRLIELDNGRQLWLAPQSSVYFAPAPSGAVDIVVASGSVWVRGQQGERFTAGTRSNFRLTPAEGYMARRDFQSEEPSAKIESPDDRRRGLSRD